MQPYFFPYIGYFKLMNAVDEFIVYDNIEFTKKGWINRNRILVNGKDEFITLPLKKDSDFLDVNDRFLAESWSQDRSKMLNRIKESYRKAPCFNEIFPLIERCILFEEKNLFDFIFNSIQEIKNQLGIKTILHKSSEIPIDHKLKSEEKVISICKKLEAKQYINPFGGISLYNVENFAEQNIELTFLKPNLTTYLQFGPSFIPYLSIMDTLMFNDHTAMSEMLQSFRLLTDNEIKIELALISENQENK